MTLERHALQLGELVSSFQSLEFLLRLFLHELPGAPAIGIPFGTDLYSYPVGSELPESELTNYDSLGKLIDRYNAEISRHGGTTIDGKLVDIRDALAHGRVSAAEEATPESGSLRLLKFSRPENGRVRVVFNEVMDESWYKAQIERLYSAITVVHGSLKPKT